MGKGKRNRAKKKSERPYVPLDAHKQSGKVLTPPLLAIKSLRTASWVDDRLPEMLWCALLITHLPRQFALEIFRRVARLLKGEFKPNEPVDIGHSGLASLPPALSAAIVGLVCSAPGVPEVLRPLLLLRDLPLREEWQRNIQADSTNEDWELLRVAVAHVFDHQSQEATDCRWLRILCMVLSGQLHLPTEEMARQIVYYPDEGDQRQVRPFIRAAEISFAHEPNGSPGTWPAAFWQQCWTDTKCLPRELTWQAGGVEAGTTLQRVDAVAQELASAFLLTATTTAVDARHEGVFGIAIFALSLLRELLRIGAGESVSARLGLRALFEARVTIAFLHKKDSPNLWQEYRNYGSGQAKLAFLKLDDEAAQRVGFVNADALSAIANEDRSADFVPINLGNWEGSNLRKMSEEAGVKEDYDRFYPWTSAYMHGNWGAVRSTSFDLCVNALHRAHRVLRSHPVPLNDVVTDGCELVDDILAVLSQIYPSFTSRVSNQAPDA